MRDTMWGPPGFESELAPWEQLAAPAALETAGGPASTIDTDPEPWMAWRSIRYELRLVKCRRVGVEWQVLEHKFTERGWRHDLFLRPWHWAATARWARWRAGRHIASRRDFRRKRR